MYRIFWFMLATLVAQIEGPQPDRSAYLDKMECGDCKQVNQECQIVSSGYFCRESEDTDLIDERKAAANLKHLSSCMAPGHFFLKREEISSACCFWAPQIGCQQVKNKLRTKPCSDCATYHERGSFLDLNPMGCPCGPPEKSGAGCNGVISIVILMCATKSIK